MSDQADSAVDGQEQAQPADSTATGQEQGDQSKRINGLQSVLGKRTSERDAALSEIDTLKAQLAQYEMAAVEPGPTQVELLLFPERYQTDDAGAGEEERDPMLPPEPPTIRMGVSPARGQGTDFSKTPVVGDMSNPSVRYANDQAQIAHLRRELNAAGQAWVDQARESGLLD